MQSEQQLRERIAKLQERQSNLHAVELAGLDLLVGLSGYFEPGLYIYLHHSISEYYGRQYKELDDEIVQLEKIVEG